MNHELAKTLTTALVQYIEKKRPEGTVCCSSYECERLEKAFEVNNLDFIEEFTRGKLSGLTEFEDRLVAFALQCGGQWDTANEEAKKWSREFIEIAKKQLLSYADESNPAIEAMADLERTYFCNPDKLPKWLKDDIARKELNAHTKGYNKGYKDAEKEYQKSVAYHYPEPVQPGVVYKALNNWNDVIVAPNTNSGTSTAKVEG